MKFVISLNFRAAGSEGQMSVGWMASPARVFQSSHLLPDNEEPVSRVMSFGLPSWKPTTRPT